MATSQKYWQKRSLERLTAAEKATEPYLERVYDIYLDAQKQTVAQIKKFYQTYYIENKWDTQALNRIVPSGDLNRFYESLERAGIAQVLPERFKGRLNRLEMLNAQMWKQTKLAAVSHGDTQTRAHAQTVVNGYYGTIFDYSQKLGATPAFNTLDSRTVEQILATRFEGANYSERIWRNTDHLAAELSGILGRAIATGQGVEKTSREVVERFNVSKSNAMRLVQTETNYFENRSELEALEEMGIDRFQFLATLDSRTSEMCRAHDKKIYKIKDAKIGDNVPPLHPWCRSTIVAYIGDEHKVLERIARDPETDKNYFVSGDIDYPTWMQQVGADKIAAAVRTTKLRSLKAAPIKRNYAEYNDAEMGEMDRQTENLLMKSTYDEINALRAYKTASDPINDALYGLIPSNDEINQFIASLDKLISKQTTKKDAVVFKGIRAEYIEKYLKADRPFKLDGFVSTSIKKSVAKEFYDYYSAYGGKAYMVEIHIPKGTPALYIGTNGSTGFAAVNEAELLTARGLYYKIISVKDNQIVMEIVR